MHCEIYTKDNCSYCQMAKLTLQSGGISFTEQKLNRDFSREQIREKFPDAKTFPIIILDGFYVGGYKELTEHLTARANSTQIQLNE